MTRPILKIPMTTKNVCWHTSEQTDIIGQPVKQLAH